MPVRWDETYTFLFLEYAGKLRLDIKVRGGASVVNEFNCWLPLDMNGQMVQTIFVILFQGPLYTDIVYFTVHFTLLVKCTFHASKISSLVQFWIQLVKHFISIFQVIGHTNS